MNPEETRTLIKSTENLNTSFLGYRESQLGIEENIGLTDNYRLTHVLDTGPTGYGKTPINVLENALLRRGHENNTGVASLSSGHS